MPFGPFSSGVFIPVPKDKRIDPLLQALNCQLMVIPHTEIFFNGIIFAGGNIDRMISTIAQAVCDQAGVTPVCFDALPLGCEHGRRCQNGAFDPGIGQLMVQRIPEASRLVTAFNRIIILGAEFQHQGFDEGYDLLVIRRNLNFSEKPVLCSDCGFHCA